MDTRLVCKVFTEDTIRGTAETNWASTIIPVDVVATAFFQQYHITRSQIVSITPTVSIDRDGLASHYLTILLEMPVETT